MTINIPAETKGFYLGKGTKELISFFNKLTSDLEYPNCEGTEDAKRILLKAEHDLIMWGKV